MTITRTSLTLLLGLCLTFTLAAPAHAILCYVDNDGDGYGDSGDPGTDDPDGICDPGFVDNNLDCDDADATVYPGAPEICDGKDNDCDAVIDDGLLFQNWYLDADGDGYGNPTDFVNACAPQAGRVLDNTDCDDADATVNPGAPEICDGLDNDCDAVIDDGLVFNNWYLDADGDGYGNPTNFVNACSPQAGRVLDGTDCDDADPSTNPGAVEICGDGLDNDCDGQVDEASTWYADADADGFGNPTSFMIVCAQPAGHVADNTDCDDTDGSVYPGAPELCDSKDNDCDGQVDEGAGSLWYADSDSDGWGDPNNSMVACSQPAGHVTNDADCDDADASVHPGAPELCNGIDDDCNGTIDDNPTNGSAWYPDSDNDGFGDGTIFVLACSAPLGYVADGSDCDDADASVNPAAVEVCDGKDNDCNGTVDDGAGTTWYIDTDGDGFGNPTNFQVACSQPAGYVADNSDCDDADNSINPVAAEVCFDGKDNNCDGQIDEGCDECLVLVTGDVNITGTLTSADIIFMVGFVFKSGAPLEPCQAAGDVNCDGKVTSADIIYEVNHVFKGGPAPCDVCTLIPSAWSCP